MFQLIHDLIFDVIFLAAIVGGIFLLDHMAQALR